MRRQSLLCWFVVWVLVIVLPLRGVQTLAEVEAAHALQLEELRAQLTAEAIPLEQAIERLRAQVDLKRAEPVILAIDKVLKRFGRSTYDDEDNTLNGRVLQLLAILEGRRVARQSSHTILGALGQVSAATQEDAGAIYAPPMEQQLERARAIVGHPVGADSTLVSRAKVLCEQVDLDASSITEAVKLVNTRVGGEGSVARRLDEVKRKLDPTRDVTEALTSLNASFGASSLKEAEETLKTTLATSGGTGTLVQSASQVAAGAEEAGAHLKEELGGTGTFMDRLNAIRDAFGDTEGTPILTLAQGSGGDGDAALCTEAHDALGGTGASFAAKTTDVSQLVKEDAMAEGAATVKAQIIQVGEVLKETPTSAANALHVQANDLLATLGAPDGLDAFTGESDPGTVAGRLTLANAVLGTTGTTLARVNDVHALVQTLLSTVGNGEESAPVDMFSELFHLKGALQEVEEKLVGLPGVGVRDKVENLRYALSCVADSTEGTAECASTGRSLAESLALLTQGEVNA